jgi:hypothetical protein
MISPDLPALPGAAASSPQTAAAVLMVRPACFGSNPQTGPSNPFQRPAGRPAEEIATQARVEFDALAVALREAGVAVHDFDDRADPRCPDAVFPNNWVSCHADGTVVLYPMLAPNRRRERRLDLLLQLERRGRFRVTRLVDLTHHEADGHYLEGTGSLVLDHVRRIAYACVSPRTHREPLAEFCAELGYEACVFAATDAAGVPVYHTNVLLTIGSRMALIAAGTLAPPDRERVLASLAAGERRVELLGSGALERFAANALELRAADGSSVLALSQTAADSFPDEQRRRLGEFAGRLVSVPIPTIERHGGGSVRCMLAEVFLPREAAQA